MTNNNAMREREIDKDEAMRLAANLLTKQQPVRVSDEELARFFREHVQIQSQGEWDDKMVAQDADYFVKALRSAGFTITRTGGE